MAWVGGFPGSEGAAGSASVSLPGRCLADCQREGWIGARAAAGDAVEHLESWCRWDQATLERRPFRRRAGEPQSVLRSRKSLIKTELRTPLVAGQGAAVLCGRIQLVREPGRGLDNISLHDERFSVSSRPPALAERTRIYRRSR